MKDSIVQIIEKPDNISWDEIHDVIWKSHVVNRKKGIYMQNPEKPGGVLRNILEEKDGKLFVAMVNGTLVGTAAFYIKRISLWCFKGKCAYFCLDSVLPEYSGLGIFNALSRRREEQVRAMGFNCMMFHTHELNKKMIDINLKNGYKLVSIHKGSKYINVILMKWINGCPYSDFYCKFQYYMRKCYIKIRCALGAQIKN